MTEEPQRHTVIPRTLVFAFRDGKLFLIKYSGRGQHQTKEKSERKGIYNALGVTSKSTKISLLNVFDDMKAIVDKIMALKENEMFTGVTQFEGFKLKSISLKTL